MRNYIHDPSDIQRRATSTERRGDRGGGAFLRAATSAALIASLASGCVDEPGPSAEGIEGLELLGETTLEVTEGPGDLALLPFSNLALLNGWTHAPFATRPAAVSLSGDGVVHLRGAIANGTHPVAFILPSPYRPATNVFVEVDMCAARKGRLSIAPSGQVWIQAEKQFSDAQCFTSLEGASYVLAAPSYKPALQNAVSGPAATRDRSPAVAFTEGLRSPDRTAM